MKDLEKAKTNLKSFNLITKECNELYRLIALKNNISDSAFWILYEIRINNCKLTQSELCKYVFLPKQTINSALKILEEKGILTLISTDLNKKNKLISLTSEGIELAKKIVDDVIESELNIFDSIDSSKVDIFLEVYYEYVEKLRKRSVDKYEN